MNENITGKPTPEQVKERMAWLSSISEQKKMADKGNTLSLNDARMVKPGNVITEGPCLENNQFVSGYMIVKTDTVDEALELAKANPIFKVGGSVEVRGVAKLISGDERK